jgi:2-hydroxy-3-oxopropionate reductase
MKIGFIGLGIMGKPMAKNLLKAGYTDLLVNNRSQASVQELEAVGAKGATQQEIGAQCDVVITMLPNSPQVKEVMLGENGVVSHMR